MQGWLGNTNPLFPPGGNHAIVAQRYRASLGLEGQLPSLEDCQAVRKCRRMGVEMLSGPGQR